LSLIMGTISHVSLAPDQLPRRNSNPDPTIRTPDSDTPRTIARQRIIHSEVTPSTEVRDPASTTSRVIAP